MTATLPIAPVETLEDLTDIILLQHSRVQMSAEQMVEAMVECGESMLRARELVEPGQWGKYVQKSLGIHIKTAGTYIRFARHADILRNEKPATIHAARKVLYDLGLPRHDSVRKEKTQAQRMRKSGKSNQQIADHFGVPRSTVQYWVHADTYKVRKAKINAEMRGAKAKMRRDKAKAAMKDAKGTDLSSAYSYIRKAVDKLQHMQNLNAEDKAVHDFVSRAMTSLYRAEDFVVSASTEKFVKA